MHPPAPKIAALQHLHAAGLPVPPGVVLDDPHDRDPARWTAISELLHGGPVIVRTALFDEDREHSAAAGLGTSIADCTTLAAVHHALTRIEEALADPWLRTHLGPAPRAQILVQRQISGPWLAVVAQGLTRYAEIHHPNSPTTTRPELSGPPDSSHEPLATTTEPELADPPDSSPRASHEPFVAGTTPPLADPPDSSPRTSHEPFAAGTTPPLADPPELSGPPDTSHEPFAAGTTPTLAGPLDLLPEDLRRRIAPLCDRVTAALPATPHGLDLELAADTTGAVWVVQARPLTRPLHREWPAFAAAASAELADLPGLWTLDAEHNPAPLSPAHAGLIRRLAAARPDLVTARVLAGWLYEPTRPRTPPTTTAAAALHALRHDHIPAARAWLTAEDLHPHDLAAALDRACAHLLEILATYAALRVPAPTTSTPALLCLQDREAHLDVLPAAWDIASPPLADLSLPTFPKAPVPSTTSNDDATLVRELDDHLFALGLAPLRRLYLRAATHLGLSESDIFLLPPDTLQSALRAPHTDLELPRRRREHLAQTTLYPPLQLLNGLPVPAPARTYLQGLAIGPPATGPLHIRHDLADLLARPLPADAILAMPALTAQAAVALHALSIKAVCCEHGGAMSHAALMARELGLSALIGCRGCTSLPEGTHVHLDTRTARLRPQ